MLERWTWSADGSADFRDRSPINITNNVINYSWQKSIKSPAGSASLNVWPTYEGQHLLDAVNPMDVVKIYEFDTLKFQGFVRNVSYSGAITQDGKPQRQGVIQATQMGGLLLESALGFNMSFLDENSDGSPGLQLIEKAGELFEAVSEATLDGDGPFADLITKSIEVWLEAVAELGGAGYQQYFERYINYTSALDSTVAPGIPRELQLYTGTEERLTVWETLQKLVEAPFQEMWMDEGPRVVNIDGNETAINDELSYLVFRTTPFNGYVDNNGTERDLFDGLKSRVIPLDYLVSFNFSRTMDEVYSMYFAIPAGFNVQKPFMATTSQVRTDNRLLTKYLYRPYEQQLFYVRMSDPESTEKGATEKEVLGKAGHAAQTLFNWFQLNDEYANGAVKIMVPNESDDRGEVSKDSIVHDIRIGEKLEVEDINGTFYVESITHNWHYQGAISSDIGVTRGYDRLAGKRMSFANAIFNKERAM